MFLTYKYSPSEVHKVQFMMLIRYIKSGYTRNKRYETDVSSYIQVRKVAKIRNRYNQVPHLTQDTTWGGDKKAQENATNKSQEVSPFSASDHKAAMNRHESIKNTRQKEHKSPTKEVPPWNMIINKNDPQKKHRLGTVGEIFTGGLKLVLRCQPHP